MTKKRKPRRSPDRDAITFVCPVKLKKAIEQAAAADRRPLSNWIASTLEDVLKAK